MVVNNENVEKQSWEDERHVENHLEIPARYESATDNLQLYLARAALPYMTPGSAAPPFSLKEKYKVHRNHLQVRVQLHRKRFIKVMAAKSPAIFSKAVANFCKKLPKRPLDEDTDTGHAFTVPAFDFKIRDTSLPHPNSFLEIMSWINALPMQTMTRSLHAMFPEHTRSWDVTTVNDAADPDKTLWQMLVWRKTPKASVLEEYYRAPPPDPVETCSMVIVVQPPWILSPGDIRSFVKSRTMPPFNEWVPDDEVPMCAAQRMWAKLWDNCVKRQCHQWVVTTYYGWIFGAFSPGFTVGQVYSVLPYDSREPTVLEALTYHVACSMGIVESKLPQALEGMADVTGWKTITIPGPEADPDMEFPDSESEWDGEDEEPGISAGVSEYSSVGHVSAYGSEHNFHRPPTYLPRHVQDGEPVMDEDGEIPVSVAGLKMTRGIQRWSGRINNGHRELPPIPERPRSASPGPLSGGLQSEAVAVYASLRRAENQPAPNPESMVKNVDADENPQMEFVVTGGTRAQLGLRTPTDGPVIVEES